MNITSSTHPLDPFLPKNARILLLGSFPPKKENWSMDFYYPNFQNDMWRIFGLIFFNDIAHFTVANKKIFDKSKIINFLSIKGIALFDAATDVTRLKDNAADKFLQIDSVIDLSVILPRIPKCAAIASTGAKSAEILGGIFDVKPPEIGEFKDVLFLDRNLSFFRLPSSSRAYPKPILLKAQIYEKMFKKLAFL